MRSLNEALRNAQQADPGHYRPEFFRLALPEDRARLEGLLQREPRVRAHDELHGQLTELVRALNPSVVFAKADLDKEALAHLGTTPRDEYGVWVYYPWSCKLVHLLDEAEFTVVRTDRNRNKITREEQEVLATKKIGVIGLSVGQSAALTLALERSFGEIRLTDFDTLELSNLNRIRSGTHALGVNKAVNTAREIAEIDPFLKVVCSTEGITEDNLHGFFTEGGELDLLVEECDSVAIKIIARQKARELRIPVVMDTSDRGMVDIERFDLEPERPILHGLVDHLDLAAAARARTPEEKLPYVIPMLGLEHLSARMKASMVELENTITTWPQLGSSVVLGGAAAGHVARCVLLGQDVPSGRWWLDLDELITSPKEPGAKGNTPAPTAPRTRVDDATMRALVGKMHPTRDALPLRWDEVEAIVEAGCLAPTGGNSQPWVFIEDRGRLFLLLDKERARTSLDPGLRYAIMGLGACLENMLVKGGSMGLRLRHAFRPLPGATDLIATIELVGRGEVPGPEVTERAKAILLRHTNRKHYQNAPLKASELDDLHASIGGDLPGMELRLVSGAGDIDHLARLCGSAERMRMLNPVCHHDMFVKEMRWSVEETQRTRDGIDVATLELGLADRTGLRIAADPKAMGLIRNWGGGRTMENLSAKVVRSSAALAVLCVPGLSEAETFTAGRALQRSWLKAAAMGLDAHPVGAPVFMGLIPEWDEGTILGPAEREEAEGILNEVTRTIRLDRGKPFFMLRIGRASGAPSARSLRRPLNEVLFSTKHQTA